MSVDHIANLRKIATIFAEHHYSDKLATDIDAATDEMDRLQKSNLRLASRLDAVQASRARNYIAEHEAVVEERDRLREALYAIRRQTSCNYDGQPAPVYQYAIGEIRLIADSALSSEAADAAKEMKP